jgi:hypothetical protein
MPQLDHPHITEMNRKGFLGKAPVRVSCGQDVFGFEILPGDEVIEHNGELILKENLRDYLEDLDFVFKVAE